MSLLSRLFGGNKEVKAPPVQHATPWEVVEAFVADPQWKVEVLNGKDGWMRLKFNGVIGEALDDPAGEWLHLRFRVPFTDEQKSSELALYEWWSNYCARNTQFRWDIDLENQEYYGDAFALIEGQYDQVECIRSIFNSALLLTQGSNEISLDRRFIAIIKSQRWASVAIALWYWFSTPLAPLGTTVKHEGFRERTYWMGTALGAVSQEQWAYYALLRFGATDFMTYMHESDERRLMLYKMHLDIQRQFPRIRNFVSLTPTPSNSGSQETSIAIVVSSGTEASAIFERCVKDVYNNLIAYTEWMNFDFTEQNAPWFDHSVKKPQGDYERMFPPIPEGRIRTS
ncbi:hypothetical protein [Deinococcus altitudinis]|uniref:hypothetical protein n=1 Tax=Deinococcus altitudinis TaxID=468914 RepID=UPI0038915351